MGSSWTSAGTTGSLRQGETPGGVPEAPIPINNSFERCPDMALGSLRQGTKGDVNFNFTKGRGAGRTREAIFPVNDALLTTNTQPSGTMLSRFGVIDTLAVAGQSPGATAILEYKGRAAYKFSAVTGRTALLGPYMNFAMFKGGGAFKGDLACWRAKAIMAFEPSGGGDLGLMITRDGGTSVLTNPATDGFTLRADATGAVTFYSKIGGATLISDACPAQIDIAEWNCYEFRMIGATDIADAQLKVLINNELQFQVNWGDNLLTTGILEVIVGTFSGGTMYLPVGGCCVAAAVDEASLL